MCYNIYTIVITKYSIIFYGDQSTQPAIKYRRISLGSFCVSANSCRSESCYRLDYSDNLITS